MTASPSPRYIPRNIALAPSQLPPKRLQSARDRRARPCFPSRGTGRRSCSPERRDARAAAALPPTAVVDDRLAKVMRSAPRPAARRAGTTCPWRARRPRSSPSRRCARSSSALPGPIAAARAAEHRAVSDPCSGVIQLPRIRERRAARRRSCSRRSPSGPSGEISQSMNAWPISFFTCGCLPDSRASRRTG